MDKHYYSFKEIKCSPSKLRSSFTGKAAYYHIKNKLTSSELFRDSDNKTPMRKTNQRIETKQIEW